MTTERERQANSPYNVVHWEILCSDGKRFHCHAATDSGAVLVLKEERPGILALKVEIVQRGR